jgi:hypothetical protein
MFLCFYVFMFLCFYVFMFLGGPLVKKISTPRPGFVFVFVLFGRRLFVVGPFVLLVSGLGSLAPLGARGLDFLAPLGLAGLTGASGLGSLAPLGARFLDFLAPLGLTGLTGATGLAPLGLNGLNGLTGLDFLAPLGASFLAPLGASFLAPLGASFLAPLGARGLTGAYGLQLTAPVVDDPRELEAQVGEDLTVRVLTRVPPERLTARVVPELACARCEQRARERWVAEKLRPEDRAHHAHARVDEPWYHGPFNELARPTHAPARELDRTERRFRGAVRVERRRERVPLVLDGTQVLVLERVVAESRSTARSFGSTRNVLRAVPHNSCLVLQFVLFFGFHFLLGCFLVFSVVDGQDFCLLFFLLFFLFFSGFGFFFLHETVFL